MDGNLKSRKYHKGIIYISKNEIVAIVEGSALGFSVNFGPGEIQNLEVTDKQIFEDEVSNFIKHNSLTFEYVTIVLSTDLLFIKQVTYNDDNDLESKQKVFIDEIPLDPSELATKIVTNHNAADFIAVNKSFYEFVIEVLEGLKIKIQAVVPEIIFNANVPSEFPFKSKSFEELFSTLENTDILNTYNFIALGEDVPSKLEVVSSYLKKKGPIYFSHKKNVAMIAILVSLAILLAILLVVQYFVKIPE